jgi:signal transduction histidine kinase
MASHEFRTPLSAILSSADLIEAYQEGGQQEKRLRHTNRIKSAVSNLTSILNDFLSLSKLEEGKVQCEPVPCYIASFCNEVLEELHALLKPGQHIRSMPIPEGLEIVVDKKLLKNVLYNLLSNAIKYSPDGKPIDFLATVNGGELHIRIRDYGIGIPEEEQQHLFTRFFRAHNVENIQGTGLGLNIVKRYLELMQGNITFESKLGEGTAFSVQIPVQVA